MGWEQGWLDYQLVKPMITGNTVQIISNCDNVRCMKGIEEITRGLEACHLNVHLTYIEGMTEGDIPLFEGDMTIVILKVEGSVYEERYGLEGYEFYGFPSGVIIKAYGDSGLLYGAFGLMGEMRMGKETKDISLYSRPSNPLRMINHWDNSDGSIERGYSGGSFFFENGHIIIDERTVDYARLMASTGINAAVVNNVNVAKEATWFITESYFKPLRQLMELFDAYGIKLFLSLNYAASMDVGGLDSADPLDPSVVAWWQDRMHLVYEALPRLGGFLIKADSEGRPGPFTYDRTHADGANMLAGAIKPYGGMIIWRCFVYNCKQDWRDHKTDRARAGYDHFMPLDGAFDDNVILQIKNGPMDFQVREPVSPLLGAMKKTNQILEVQIAQEYTGQQRHVCYLMPMFKEVLEFDTHNGQGNSLIKDVANGQSYGNVLCGMAAVSNTGNDPNWTGHDLASANLYGYGRLAWDTNLCPETIAKEWITLTFGRDPEIIENISKILMMSWPAYEKYTSPLGIGWMVNPNHHYGPNVDGYEYDRWGTYHRTNHLGTGVDRSDKGTGYASQYYEPNYKRYNDIKTCPEELLLFFHHVPFDHVLSSGKTVIQHIYDTHFEGVEDVETMRNLWQALAGKIEDKVFERVNQRFDHQLEHSKEWRDRINTYFYRMTLTKDLKERRIYE